MEYITTANVLAWVFFSLGLLVMFVSYWLASAALFPRQVERCERQFGRPVVTTLAGLLVFAVPLVAGIALAQALPAALKWIGILLAAMPVMLGLVGSAGLARRIGVGLPSALDATQPWRAVLRGGVVLSLTFLLPILGQFVVMPLVLAAGSAATVFSWFGGRKETGRKATVPGGAAEPDLHVEGVS
jgi:hypothetical protein